MPEEIGLKLHRIQDQDYYLQGVAWYCIVQYLQDSEDVFSAYRFASVLVC